jgi:hypothetical protein
VYANLDYFLIPFTRVWDYSRVSQMENLYLLVYLQVQDSRLCGYYRSDSRIAIYNMDTTVIEKIMKGHGDSIRGIIQVEDGRLC